jgi:predicted Zn-dependent protease
MSIVPRVLLPCLLAALLSACATNPVTGQRQVSLMSEGDEIALGKQMDAQVRQEMGVYDDAEWQQYVSDMGRRLATQSHRPNLPWTFAVVDTPTVNAFALPGGYIYVTRGLLAHLGSEAELAGVLGHEIGHVTARHAAQSYTRSTTAQLGLALGSIFFPEIRPYGQLAGTGLSLLFLKHGRDAEIEADELGAKYAFQTGWDPAGIAGMLQTLSRLDEVSADRRGVPNFLSTHPEPLARVEHLTPLIAGMAPGPGDLRRGRDAYLRRVDGLMFGDNPREGVVRGNAFLHPGLRIALEFPEGWTIQNTSTQVRAGRPGAQEFVFLDLVREPQGRTLAEVAQRNMAAAGLRALEGEAVRLGEADAFVGTFEGTAQNGARVVARAAYVGAGQNVYRLAGVASAQQYRSVAGAFDQTIRSFRTLSPAEAERIRPNRIVVRQVRAGDTWESLARDASQGTVTAAALAVMNGSPPSDPPEPGSTVKLVVGR